MYLILDTETTGVSPTDRIVSICWGLYNTSTEEAVMRYHVITPNGFTIPSGASAIHGITTEIALRRGVPIAAVLAQLKADITSYKPTLYVGHNVAFDRPIVLNEYRRLASLENISPLPTYCTMKSTTSLCCLPRRGGGYKWPKLEELHRHLFGAVHAGTHDAQGDVRATARCFFELSRRTRIG